MAGLDPPTPEQQKIKPRDDEDDPLPHVPVGDAMLAYVAVTRAKLTLDRTGLAWLDKFLATLTATAGGDPA